MNPRWALCESHPPPLSGVYLVSERPRRYAAWDGKRWHPQRGSVKIARTPGEHAFVIQGPLPTWWDVCGPVAQLQTITR